MKPFLSCVIPCFNEEETLPELYRRVTAALEAAPISGYELILVNDGSQDDSWTMMSGLCANDTRVVAINLARNHGHQLALTAGLHHSHGDLVLVIDADLQDPPELINEMMAVMKKEGADVVYGQRRQRAGETWFKRASAAAFYRFLGCVAEVDIPADTGDFRLMTRRITDTLNAMPEQHRFIRGMVSWIGYRQVPFLYDRAARFAGETKYPLRKMLRFAVDAITGFSISPLRLASLAGAITGGLAILLLVYTLISWVTDDTVRGWSSIMGTILLFGSVQMFVLGIMGEYLGRLYLQSKGRPLFLIADICHAQEPPEETPP
ncbi:MAG: glycosyltransferase family 2 protein [Rhodospirillaceae bacterium]|nr:glycosyltransferase family 2 protein [Rhodospirillaceae bacterium]